MIRVEHGAYSVPLTWIHKLNLVQGVDAKVEFANCLLIFRGCLHLQEEDRRCDVDTVRQRQHAVVDGKGSTEKVEDGNDCRC